MTTVATIPQGEADSLHLSTTLVVWPGSDPLPETVDNGSIPAIVFSGDNQRARLTILLTTQEGRRAQAMYLYALADAINTLAHKVEESRREVSA